MLYADLDVGADDGDPIVSTIDLLVDEATLAGTLGARPSTAAEQASLDQGPVLVGIDALAAVGAVGARRLRCRRPKRRRSRC